MISEVLAQLAVPPSGALKGGQLAMETLIGTWQVVVRDDFKARVSRQVFFVVTGGHRTPVIFDDPATPTAIRPGSLVSVRGVRVGEAIHIATFIAGTTGIERLNPGLVGVSTIKAADAHPVAKGTRNIGVFPISYPNAPAGALTKDQFTAFMSQLANRYLKDSYGALNITWVLHDYAVLPTKICLTSLDEASISQFEAAIGEATTAISEDSGDDLSKYQTLLYLFDSDPACQPRFDYASFGGSPGSAWAWGDPDQAGKHNVGVTAHEIGHNLGLGHSHSWFCGSSQYRPDGSCMSEEYGDMFDLMGGGGDAGVGLDMNAMKKEYLGWLSPLEVRSTGTYLLAPLELESDAPPRALKVIPPDDNTGVSDLSYLYVEYRQPIGNDAWLQDFLSDGIASVGINLHVGLPITGLENNGLCVTDFALVSTGQAQPGCITWLIDTNPPPENASAPWKAPLLLGETYADFDNRFSVTVADTTPASASLDILVPTPVAPTELILKPQSGDKLLAGSVAEVKVIALDRHGISSVELFASPNGSSNQFLIGSISQAPFNFAWNLTQVEPGDYTLTAKTTNANGIADSSSIQVVVSPPTIDVGGVAVGQVFQSGVTFPLSLSVFGSSPGFTVQVSLRSSSRLIVLCGGMVPACASLGVSLPPGTYALQAKLLAQDGTVVATSGPEVNFVVTDESTTADPSSAATEVSSSVTPLVDAATFGPNVAPGSLVSGFIKGPNLTPTVSVYSTPLPTVLSDLSLAVTNRPFPLLYASQAQVNAQLPFEISPGVTTVTVTAGGLPFASLSCNVTATAPAIFQYGMNWAIAENSNGVLNSSENPARTGTYISVYLTGQGMLDKLIPDGQPAPPSPLFYAITSASVYIGTTQATVQFLGLAPGFVGLGQANVLVPNIPPGTYPLKLTMGGITSNSPTVAVQ